MDISSKTKTTLHVYCPRPLASGYTLKFKRATKNAAAAFDLDTLWLAARRVASLENGS